MKYLETTKPLATFSEDKLPMLSKIIKKYDWQLMEVASGIYNKGINELCFNGRLTKIDYNKAPNYTLTKK